MQASAVEKSKNMAEEKEFYMKKLLAVIAALAVTVCGAFAQENEPAGDSWVDHVRIEADVELGLMQFGLEARGAYRFPINDILAWDAGVEMGWCMPGFLVGLSNSANNVDNSKLHTFTTEAFASFWFWDFYVSYGLGFAVNAGYGPMLIPADVRVGWQPNFRKTDNGFIFKMELGLLPCPTGNVVTDEMVALTLGATYKF